MKVKTGKKIILTLVMVLAIGQTSMVASAHGHQSHHCKKSTTYSQCTVKSCTSTKKHKHNGKTYLPCSPCTVEGCTSTKKHKHHGKMYLPCSINDHH